MRSLALHVSAWALQLGALLLLWLLLSFLTSSLLFEGVARPLPGVAMAWGALAACGGFIAAFVLRRQLADRYGAFLYAFAVAGLGALLGMEAGLPTALALGAALGWMRVDGPGRLARWMKRYRIAAYLVLLVLCAELLLQAAAGAVHFQMRQRSHADRDAYIRVLCIGDSYTFGVGASSPEHAWPAVLQGQLGERFPGRRISVVNAGLPAQNSSILLHHMVELLPAARPQVVIVSCGINNRWNLTGLNLSDAGDVSRSQRWRILARQAALRVRLYRAFVLSGFQLQDPALVATPAIDPSSLPAGIAPTTDSTAGVVEAEGNIARMAARVEEHPEDGPAWSALASACFIAGRTAEAIAVSERAKQLDPTAAHMWYARVHSLIQMGSPEAALAACAESLERGCTPLFYPFIAMPACGFSDSQMQAHLVDLAARRPDLRKLLAWIPEDYYGQNRYQNVLRADLFEMDRQCRRVGARLVIHGYPFNGPPNDTLILSAREIGCPYVSHMLALNHELLTARHDEIYVSDGHCTDRGYAILADNLLPVVLETLEKAGITRARR